jgi:hypothetical protein
MRAPKNAAQKPATWNPFMNDVAQKTSAFITNKKNPRVKILNGKVIIFKTVPSVAFKTPNTIATKTATQKLATKIPGTMAAAARTPRALNKMRKMSFIAYIIPPINFNFQDFPAKMPV